LDNRATQQKAIDDHGSQPRIVRRATIDRPLSVGIDGRLVKDATAMPRSLQPLEISLMHLVAVRE
jgi:hypothetical protein